eukprot:4844304-Alexandrium_andersonii.AAC.1
MASGTTARTRSGSTAIACFGADARVTLHLPAPAARHSSSSTCTTAHTVTSASVMAVACCGGSCVVK